MLDFRSVLLGILASAIMVADLPASHAAAPVPQACKSYCQREVRNDPHHNPRVCGHRCKRATEEGWWTRKYVECQTTHGSEAAKCDALYWKGASKRVVFGPPDLERCSALCAAQQRRLETACLSGCAAEMASGVLTQTGLDCWLKAESPRAELLCFRSKAPKKYDQLLLASRQSTALDDLRQLKRLMTMNFGLSGDGDPKACAVPPAPPCASAQAVCKPPATKASIPDATWNAKPWKTLGFTPTSKVHSYCYTTRGKGASTRIELHAYSDLDCDGSLTKTTMQLRGTIEDDSCGLRAGPTRTSTP